MAASNIQFYEYVSRRWSETYPGESFYLTVLTLSFIRPYLANGGWELTGSLSFMEEVKQWNDDFKLQKVRGIGEHK
jgi:hypothetical protein